MAANQDSYGYGLFSMNSQLGQNLGSKTREAIVKDSVLEMDVHPELYAETGDTELSPVSGYPTEQDDPSVSGCHLYEEKVEEGQTGRPSRLSTEKERAVLQNGLLQDGIAEAANQSPSAAQHQPISRPQVSLNEKPVVAQSNSLNIAIKSPQTVDSSDSEDDSLLLSDLKTAPREWKNSKQPTESMGQNKKRMKSEHNSFDSNIVILDDQDEKEQFGPGEYLTATENTLNSIRSLTGSSAQQQKERKLIDLLFQTLRIEGSKKTVSMEKLYSDKKFQLPVAVTVPTSQIVELIVEHEAEHPLRKVISGMFPGQMVQMTESEMKDRRMVGGCPVPNMTRLLMNIGQDLVQEATYCDIVHARNLPDIPKNIDAFKQVAEQLRPVWEQLKKKNECCRLTYHRCNICPFKTDSLLVMSRHKQEPHYDGRRWKCALCSDFDTNYERFKNHYHIEHGIAALQPEEEPKAACPCCPAEFPFKTTRDVHLKTCKREYLRRGLLQPILPQDDDVLNRWLWRKPPVSAFSHIFSDKEMQQQGQQRSFGHFGDQMRLNGPLSTLNQRQRGQLRMQQLLSQQHAANTVPSQRLAHPMLQQQGHYQQAMMKPPIMSGQNAANVPTIQSQLQKATSTVCEICDALFDERSRYLLHLQMYHKQLQSKTVVDMQQGAPLACSRCRQRFWTYDGLERHLVMLHGLVTSDLLSKAHKKEDSGRCRHCGKQYAFNVLQHLVTDHNVRLCSAEIMYSCDVCSFKCSRYSALEAHLAVKHPTSKSILNNQSAAPIPIQPVKTSTSQLQSGGHRPMHSTFLKSLKRPESSDQTAVPAKRPRIKYTCTPCDLKFEQYSEVIGHWQRSHLRKTLVKLCRFDLCPVHRTQLEQQYEFDFVYPEPSEERSQDEVITLE